jgi:hypothetical protein
VKIFFWTMVAVVAGIFVYTQVTKKKLPFSRNNPAPGTTYKDALGNTLFAGPDVDTQTGAYLPPDAKAGTVEFSAQNN